MQELAHPILINQVPAQVQELEQALIILEQVPNLPHLRIRLTNQVLAPEQLLALDQVQLMVLDQVVEQEVVLIIQEVAANRQHPKILLTNQAQVLVQVQVQLMELELELEQVQLMEQGSVLILRVGIMKLTHL